MADNYLQRSNRQDDSRFGNDDPLMELSRIMGTPEQDESPSGSNDDFALDLERELMGGFDDEVISQSASADTDGNQQHERGLAATQPEQPYDVPAQPVAAYEEPDYADYEPETAYADSEAGEGIVSNTQFPTPAAPVATAPAISLEDELETLLAGSARPVIQRSANASWGYGSRSNVAGRTEAAPIISRATAYQQPEAAPVPAPVAYAQTAPVAHEQPAVETAAPVAYAAPSPSYEQQAPYVEQENTDIEIEDAFDDQELIAALDDFEVPMDADDELAPVREQIAVPVAAPIVGAPKLPEINALSDYADELDRAAKPVQAPDVDTIAVTENRVDYTESLDLPTVNYEDDAPQSNGLNELESEFAEVFGSIESDTQHNDFAATKEPAKPEAAKDEYADIYADVFGSEAEQGRYNQGGHTAAGVAAAGVAGIVSQAPVAAARYQHGPEDDANFGYDPRQDDVDIAAGVYAQNENKPRRNPLFVPGVAAAVVLVAVAGAVAYKWTGSTGGEPVVIMADKAPIKVQPEKTANAVVPNQDKAVFDKDATAAPVAPKQEQLVTTREDPVDLAADEDGEVPLADKVDARIDPADQDLAANEPAPERNNALAPRKVQTMVVKPDGTMVASISPDAPPAGTGAAASPVARPGGTATGPVSADDPVGALAGGDPVEPEPALAPVTPAAAVPVAAKAQAAAAKPVETKKITQETVAAATPRNVPVVESRPAEQPLDIVDRVPARNAPAQQVASAAPAAGSYFIQVASQPSVEGAQKTYATLSQKHAGLIGGRGVDIKQAEIAGKGTYYRVRIPVGSKSDAVNLCSRYKSAGGSCFVTQ
ncbi:SPOR domain-containing protein [Phyllobacterium sp. K27]